jgi:hypothetical protein
MRAAGGHMSVRRNSHPTVSLSPLLIQIIHAARCAADASSDRVGHDRVVSDLSRWALVYVPSRGVLAPSDDDAYKVIEQTAMRHLRLNDARAALRKALDPLPSTSRNDIEEVQNWIHASRDDAYYYAGLVCGITLAQMTMVP